MCWQQVTVVVTSCDPVENGCGIPYRGLHNSLQFSFSKIFVCSCLLCLVWQLPPATFWLCFGFVDLLWCSIMHPTRHDLVILLLQGFKSPISALFNFYAGGSSEKLMLRSIVCQSNGIFQYLHCWKCFPGEVSHRTFYPLTNNPFFSTNYHSAVTGTSHPFFANSLFQDSEVGKPQQAVQCLMVDICWDQDFLDYFWLPSRPGFSTESTRKWMLCRCYDLSTGSWNIG